MMKLARIYSYRWHPIFTITHTHARMHPRALARVVSLMLTLLLTLFVYVYKWVLSDCACIVVLVLV